MRKRITLLVAIILCLAVVFSLTGCGKTAEKPATDSNQPVTNQPATDQQATDQPAAGGDVIVLKVASFLPEADNLSAMFVYASPKIEELSGGTIKFENYYNGTLLNFSEMFSGVSDGIADIGLVGMAVMDSNTYLNQVFSMLHKGCPETLEETSEIYWQIMDEFPEIQAELADHNLIRIGLQPFAGNDTLICSIKPLTTVEDFKGLTIQSSQIIVGDYFTSLGASSVAMEVFEFYSALERGITEGVYDAWSSFSALKLMEVSSDYTKFGNGGISSGIMNVVMNNSVYSSLTEEQQGWIREAIAYGISESVNKKFYPDRDAAVAYAGEHGTIHLVEGEALDAFYDAMDPVIEDWFGKMEAQGFTTARDIYDRIEELFKESRT